MSKKKQRKSPEEIILAPFECHGIEFSDTTGNNKVGDCPFCDKEEHFYVDAETGQWDCKHCGLSGNTVTFLGRMAAKIHKETPKEKFKELEDLRGLPYQVFRDHKMGWDGHMWLIPIFSETETVRDIRRWDGKNMMSTTGCSLQLFGLDQLAGRRSSRGENRVWICEGEWDAMAMGWLLRAAGNKEDVVVGPPGAHVFKEKWFKWFKGWRALLVYDNDDPGDTGSLKLGHALKGEAYDIKYIHWPGTRPQGFDIRDFVVEVIRDGLDPRKALKILEDLLHSKHRQAASSPEDEADQKEEKPATFQEVVKVFKDWVSVDQEFEDALAICLAVCLSNGIIGDPLWFYIVAPPGSGKTLILMTLKDTDRTVFKSSLTPASLVSGFNTHPDPSLLPKLDGKTAVFKDGTELLALHPDARRETYSTLRGAFDGVVDRAFGNGVTRNYEVHFNMLVGITPAINGESQSAMGDRFLRLYMRDDDETIEEKIESAIDKIPKHVEMEAALADVVRRFLLVEVDGDNLPPAAAGLMDRIIALSRVLSVLRAQVERESYGDREIKYRPNAELGTRIGKQLVKLGQMLCYVYNKKMIDGGIFRLIKRVVFDTCVDYHLDIVKALLKNPNDGLTQTDISRLAKMSSMGCLRRLQDLEALNVVRKVQQDKEDRVAVGPTPTRWYLTEKMITLWHRGVPSQNGAIKRKRPQGG